MRVRESSKRVNAYLKLPYSRILIPQEGGGYSTEILEFPGCFSEGETAEEAYANLESTARSWIAACLEGGMPIPDPITNYDASRQKSTFLLRMPMSLHTQAAKAAKKEGVSLNQYIIWLLSHKLGHTVK